MKWFIVESRDVGDSDYEAMLYRSMCERQIWLPQIQGKIPERFRKTLRIPLPLSAGRMRWKENRWPTQEEYNALVAAIIKLAPDHEAEIRALRPSSEIGHLMIDRIGPACPEIQNAAGAGYVAREILEQRLNGIEGITCFPAFLNKVVPLNWRLGEPMPELVMRVIHMHGGEPEDFIIHGRHSPEVAAEMGAFFEVVLPSPHRWHPFAKIPQDAIAVRVAFEGSLPAPSLEPVSRRGLVELAVEGFGRYPWFRVLPADQEMLGLYEFVREDVVEILREPGKWTLEFQEVEIV